MLSEERAKLYNVHRWQQVGQGRYTEALARAKVKLHTLWSIFTSADDGLRSTVPTARPLYHRDRNRPFMNIIVQQNS